MDPVAPVAVHLQAWTLDATREHMARAAAQLSTDVSPQGQQTPEVILELSAAARQLLG
jgi:hypothetical protein